MQILATKLHLPGPRPGAVPRPRLVERLNEGLHRKLTLVAAPAGFGKSTLISTWAAGCGRRVGWLSLDAGDSDPARFLAYLVAAIQTAVGPGLGRAALALLDSPQPPSPEAVLTALLNEVAAVPKGCVLVLDDYHVIGSGPIGRAVAFLVDHLPPQMHLVISTREEPDLSLARLRARGQLTEVRAADLRFTLPEAAGFLNRAMGLDLSTEQVAALEARTEGWIAGLQLAAISMQGQPDATGFIQSFTGSHRFVMDYLVEEVLKQQPASVQEFLVRTAVLGRLSGPLCGAVLEVEPSAAQESLEYLERANLLLVPLDARREWYRYHHLFAESLEARLLREQPDQVDPLHLRASDWFEQNGFRPEAVQHALAAHHFERAADLIERERSEKGGTSFRSATWLGWVRALPDALVRSRPRLSLGYAWELLFLGEMEAAAERLRDAERLLELPGAPAGEGSGEGALGAAAVRSLRASVAVARAFHAQSVGDVAATARYGQRALTLVDESDQFTRGLIYPLLGLAALTGGDLETGFNRMEAGMNSLRRAGNLVFATSGMTVLAEIRVAQGRLRDAARIYEEALARLSATGQPVVQGMVDLHLGLSGINLEWGNTEEARRHLLKAEEMGEPGAMPDWPSSLYLAQARMQEAEGDLEGALELLAKAEWMHYRTPVPDLRPIPARRARLWIRLGRLAEAHGWAERRGLSVGEHLSFLREFEQITLARLLIACHAEGRGDGSLADAVGLLERLLTGAEEGGRRGSAIEILALLGLAQGAAGDTPQALARLGRALTLAEPEGYVRVFVAEGAPMAELLGRLRAERRAGLGRAVEPYLTRLLTAFDGPRPQLLIEPLSVRELEVLRLIAQGLSNQAIAERLFLAESSVKGHNQRIFGKLGVQRRTEAVARARELGLL